MTTLRRNQVDLHTHTARSDGVLPPLVLYEQMCAWGSAVVAITDHDTLAGARELLAAGFGASSDAPQLIVGVEINTRLDAGLRQLTDGLPDAVELHILGFGVDPTDARFESRLADQREGRRTRLAATLARLDELGMPVRDQLPEVPGGIDAQGRPHVARALVSAGHAASVSDAFGRYLGPGMPAYVRRGGMGPQDAIGIIGAAGGIAALAHAPWVVRQPALLDRLCDWGLGGLEAYYRGWDEATAEAVAGCAAARGLLATGGSDYHGDDGSYAAAQALVHVPRAAGERLLMALGRR